MIPDLERLQRQHHDTSLLRTERFANQSRRGLLVVSYEFCQQFESYCKGLCLHQSGFANDALVYYSQSLTQGGRYSQNRMRLNALEAIELIIREKKAHEQRMRRMRGVARRAKQKGYVAEPTVWANCKSIYKWLSHHYI